MYRLNSSTFNFEVIYLKALYFFVKLTAFVVIVLFILFQCISPQFATGYNAALVDKYSRLESIKEPKIILVGDSNVAFGFDSKKIQDTFGMPVVNFGLHGALKLPFYADMIKSNIRNGDIVIIAPFQYNDDGDPYIFDYVMTWITIENNYRLWTGLSYKIYKNLLQAYPTYLKRTIGLWITNRGNQPVEGPYSRAAFNAFGDIDYPRTESNIPEEQIVEYESYANAIYYLSTGMEQYWNEYNKDVISKGAILYMSCPPIPIKFEELNLDIDKIQIELETRLDFPMISKLKDYILPMENFFDTMAHLTDAGVELRTNQLISDLDAALNG